MKLITYFFTIFLVIMISSCSKNQYLYDQVGFEPGAAPAENRSNATGQVPGYYYRAAPTAPPYYPPQRYQPPYQQAPGSRFYSNPYAIPPAPYYPAYDSDQYYVPPSYYYGTEPQQNNSLPGLRY